VPTYLPDIPVWILHVDAKGKGTNQSPGGKGLFVSRVGCQISEKFSHTSPEMSYFTTEEISQLTKKLRHQFSQMISTLVDFLEALSSTFAGITMVQDSKRP